jgi:hypothetical protein
MRERAVQSGRIIVPGTARRRAAVAYRAPTSVALLCGLFGVGKEAGALGIGGWERGYWRDAIFWTSPVGRCN